MTVSLQLSTLACVVVSLWFPGGLLVRCVACEHTPEPRHEPAARRNYPEILKSYFECAVLERADYTFSENGLVAHKGTEQLAVQSLTAHLGEDNLKRLLNFILKYLADVDIPVKRGTFIEFRAGMLNVSPIGRNCSQEERDAFENHDKETRMR